MPLWFEIAVLIFLACIAVSVIDMCFALESVIRRLCALYLSKNTSQIYRRLQMQTRPYTDLQGGCLTSARRVPLKCRFPILDEQFCVVDCVVTLPSLPVSGAVGCCHSGTGEGQVTAGKPA